MAHLVQLKIRMAHCSSLWVLSYFFPSQSTLKALFLLYGPFSRTVRLNPARPAQSNGRPLRRTIWHKNGYFYISVLFVLIDFFFVILIINQIVNLKSLSNLKLVICFGSNLLLVILLTYSWISLIKFKLKFNSNLLYFIVSIK